MPNMDRQVLNDDNRVYLYEEGVYGELLVSGAYFSLIRYTLRGNDFEVLVENDDFVLLSDLENLDYWEDPE